MAAHIQKAGLLYRVWLISRLHASGVRRFFQVALLIPGTYNVKMGSAGGLYTYSTAAFAWADSAFLDLDGASLPTHNDCTRRLAFGHIQLRMRVWQATFIQANASSSASATG